MRKQLVPLALFVVTFAVCSVFAIGSHEKMLSEKLHFDEAAVKSEKPLTVVLNPELLAVSREHRVMFGHFTFDLGEALGVNQRRALEANYKNVVVVSSRDAVKTKLSIEPKFYSFDTRLPGPVFGTYKAMLKVGFVVRDKARSAENEHIEDVVGTDKRSAGRVLFDIEYMRDNNSNDKRLGIAANDAMKTAIDGLLQAIK